jgi:FkbM family methyltransferase
MLTGMTRRTVASVAPTDGGEAGDPGIAQDRHDNERMALLLAFALRADSSCIDVGCHEGGFLREVLRLAPEGRHLAFEPIPHLYEYVASEFPDVDIRRIALSDAAGTATFMHVRDLPGYSGLRRRTYPGEQDVEEITVETARLDDVLPADFVPALVKIDVEGAEELVLRGAERTLRRHQPIVVFEHGLGAADHYGTQSVAVWDIFRDAGMRIFDLDANGPYGREEFQDEFLRNRRWNFVAHA